MSVALSGLVRSCWSGRIYCVMVGGGGVQNQCRIFYLIGVLTCIQSGTHTCKKHPSHLEPHLFQHTACTCHCWVQVIGEGQLGSTFFMSLVNCKIGCNGRSLFVCQCACPGIIVEKRRGVGGCFGEKRVCNKT